MFVSAYYIPIRARVTCYEHTIMVNKRASKQSPKTTT